MAASLSLAGELQQAGAADAQRFTDHTPCTPPTCYRTSMNDKGHPKYLRDVKQLNTETMVWGRCRGMCAGYKSQLANHCTHSLTLSHTVFGDHPTERGGAATCNISNVMVMFGGWAGVKRCQVCEQPQGASAKGDIDHQPDCPPGKVSLFIPLLDAHKVSLLIVVMLWLLWLLLLQAIAAAGKPAPAAEGDKHPHLYLLNMDTMEWNQPLVRGTMPSRRYVCLPCDGRVESCGPTLLTLLITPFAHHARYNHSISTVDNRLLIFGGWDGNRPLNDVVQLEFMTVSEEASAADA